MPSLPAPAANLFASSLPSFLFRRRKQSYELNPAEESYQVVYLGNVLTAGLGKGEASVDKPLSVIWRTWNAKRGQRQQIGMKLAVTRSGLKAETKQLGLTEYWAHRITYCMAPQQYPRVFCWVYKHEGKRMKPELRCHAVLCKRNGDPAQLQKMLSQYLHAALLEYKREKLAAERARKNSLGTVCPRRKLLLQTGVLNFRPPVSRSRSAPRLGSIDEEDEEECPQILAVKTAQNVPTLEVKCEEEDEEEFSDLDAHSLNLDAHYRTTPALSGDSASQQSAPSAASSTCGDSKRDETEEESSGFQQQDDDHFGDSEDCSASTSSKASTSSATSTSSGNSSLESSSSLLIDNVAYKMSAFSLSTPPATKIKSSRIHHCANALEEAQLRMDEHNNNFQTILCIEEDSCGNNRPNASIVFGCREIRL